MMAKKGMKKALRKMLKEERAKGYGYGQAPNEDGGMAPLNAGFLSSLGLPTGYGSSRAQQFLLGALLGAAATYVLSNDELRGKIVKGAMKLYGNVAGGMAELKEQMEDLKAEMEAERVGE